MRVFESTVNYDHAYLLPIGDTHLGGCEVDEDLLLRNIDWVNREPHCRVVLMGDLIDVATRVSKTSPFQQNVRGVREQIDLAVNYFTPIKDKIICAIDGNHELRLEDYCGWSPTISICERLGIQYGRYSCVVLLRVGKEKKSNDNLIYSIYAHHTTGGGNTIGGKMNRCAMLREIVTNCDVYLSGHNHMIGAVPSETREIKVKEKKVIKKRQLFVDCGSYLNWDESYSESKMLKPNKPGSPRIRFSGGRGLDKKDVHCSI